MPDNRAPTLDYHSPDDPPPTNESLRAALGCALTCILLFLLAALFMAGSAAGAWVYASVSYGRYIMITGTVFCLLLSLGLYLLFRRNSWGFLKGVLIGRFIILVLEGLCYFRLFR